MSLDQDTKTALAGIQARVDNDEVDAIVAIGGKTVFNDDGEETGIQAFNVADGTNVAISNLLAEFMKKYVSDAPDSSILILATMLQQLLTDKFGMDVDQKQLAGELVEMIKKIREKTHH